MDLSSPALTGLNLKFEYTTEDAIIDDFYVPCISRSCLYRRAVGYFTSAGLSIAGKGIAHLISAGGKIRLMASPCLSEEDVDAIENGYFQRDNLLKEVVRRTFQEIHDDITKDRLNALAWLISSGAMEVKLALPLDGLGKLKRGIFHEKLGIFSDTSGNSVVFSGSSNETVGGLVENYEAIDVFCSWEDVRPRVDAKIARFDQLWGSGSKGLEVIDFTDASRELLQMYKREPYPFRDLGELSAIWDKAPDEEASQDRRWRHQVEASDRFMESKAGILEMATGTGKTRTSLEICKKLLKQNLIDTIIVAADGNDLLDQWYDQLVSLCNTLGREIVVFRQYRTWKERDRFLVNPADAIFLTSREYLGPALKNLTQEQAQRTFVIQDEVHRLGSDGNQKSLVGLMESVPYRLGLSATPERDYDQTGNDFIKDTIGPVIFKFELSDAIRRGILAPFNYYPIEWVPNDADREAIQQVYKIDAARKHAGNPMSKEELYIKISKVYKNSKVKLPLLLNFLKSNPTLLERAIVFVDTTEYGQDVLEIIHSFKTDFHTYYSGEDAETLKRFAAGELGCLITCHRLSEGIDIRSLKSVFLLSCDRARIETIQRMGRCLRTDPQNPEKIAHVIDFIRTGDGEPRKPTFDEERRDFLSQLSLIRPEE